MEKRPGEASVQFDAMRGEAAADRSDVGGIRLEDWAKQLGFKGPGDIVGVSIFGGAEGPGHQPEFVHVTFQVVDDLSFPVVQSLLAESGGKLTVREYHKSNVPVVDFLRCFKRLEVSLFDSEVKATKISVADDIEPDGTEG